jgi:hypothetical protein
MNENHDEFSRASGLYVTALMPDSAEACKATHAPFDCNTNDDEENNNEDKKTPANDFIIVTGTKPPRAQNFCELHSGPSALYSPWLDGLGAGADAGSYYYKGRWETIDHFLLNSAFFRNNGWTFKGARVCDSEPFVRSGGKTPGTPAAYSPRTGGGISDHLPLLLLLERKSSAIDER